MQALSQPSAPATLYPTEQLLTDLIDARAVETSAGRAGWDGWAASSIGYCYRSQFLQRRGVPHTKPPERTSNQYLWMGTVIGDGIAQEFENAGLLYRPETPCACGPRYAGEFHFENEELRIRGHLDVVLEDRVIEIKSTDPGGLFKAHKFGPNDHYRPQLGAAKLAYDLDPSWLPCEPKAWELMIVARDREHGGERRFPPPGVFPLQESWTADARRRLDDLNALWEAGVLPPCTCTWMRAYCAWGDGTRNRCCLPEED